MICFHRKLPFFQRRVPKRANATSPAAMAPASNEPTLESFPDTFAVLDLDLKIDRFVPTFDFHGPAPPMPFEPVRLSFRLRNQNNFHEIRSACSGLLCHNCSAANVPRVYQSID